MGTGEELRADNGLLSNLLLFGNKCEVVVDILSRAHVHRYALVNLLGEDIEDVNFARCCLPAGLNHKVGHWGGLVQQT
jgi:hypothetical protein